VRRAAAWAVAGALAALYAAAAAAGEGQVQLKPGNGRELTSSRCILCHSLEYIPANAPALDRAGWQKTVQKMRERFGAPISDEEARTILDYLAASYAGKS
jgi:sulfite dehydrogenase (cytochrome) subunit B